MISTLKGHVGSVTSVVYSKDGSRHIISGSNDRTIRVWNIETGETIATLEGHRSEVTAVSLSPDNTQIVTGSWDDTVRIWNIRKHIQLKL